MEPEGGKGEQRWQEGKTTIEKKKQGRNNQKWMCKETRNESREREERQQGEEMDE